MLLLHRARAAVPEPTVQGAVTHTLVPLADAEDPAWPVCARRSLHRLPARLGWAAPLLDPDHPSELDCTHAQARELLLWLHHLPSNEHPIVGCHRRRPA